MAARMDGYAERHAGAGMRAEWAAMAACWRGLAHHADWQDRLRVRTG